MLLLLLGQSDRSTELVVEERQGVAMLAALSQFPSPMRHKGFDVPHPSYACPFSTTRR